MKRRCITLSPRGEAAESELRERLVEIAEGRRRGQDARPEGVEARPVEGVPQAAVPRLDAALAVVDEAAKLAAPHAVVQRAEPRVVTQRRLEVAVGEAPEDANVQGILVVLVGRRRMPPREVPERGAELGEPRLPAILGLGALLLRELAHKVREELLPLPLAPHCRVALVAGRRQQLLGLGPPQPRRDLRRLRQKAQEPAPRPPAPHALLLLLPLGPLRPVLGEGLLPLPGRLHGHERRLVAVERRDLAVLGL